MVTFGSFMFLCRVSNDPELYHKVAGVLVESNGDKLLGQWKYLPIFRVLFVCLVALSLRKCSVSDSRVVTG